MNNLLTMQQMINNSSYQTVQNFINSFGQQLLIYATANVPSLTYAPEVVITNVLIQEFLLRVPYEQNLNKFQIRLVGILNKYTPNYENNIDVLNDNFKYNVVGNSFYLSDLYKTFERSLEISDEKVALIGEINAKLDCPQYLGRFSYLGQILTDFENGFCFKNILEQKQYDGYVFSESVGVDTVSCTDIGLHF